MGYISRLTRSLAVLKQEIFDMVINGQANYTYHPNLQTIQSRNSTQVYWQKILFLRNKLSVAIRVGLATVAQNTYTISMTR